MLSPEAKANRHGIAAMCLSMASFLVNDSLVKHVSAQLPAAQLICLRGVFAVLLLLAVGHALGQLRPPGGTGPGVWSGLRHPAVLWRSALDAMATFAYLNSLFHLPLANATAINMASPLFLTLYAMLRWRESVNAARWIAILAGFGGVLLVVQPASDGFNVWAMVCLLATVLHTARDLVTRQVPATVPSILITLATAGSVTLLSGAWALMDGWQPMTRGQVALLATAAAFLSVGYFFVIVAIRHGEISVVAPFRYSGLLVALVLGWAVWGDVPNVAAWVGIALLVGSGVWMLRSQR